MINTEYYDCLGLKKTASHDEIKQAYRKLALVLMAWSRNIILIKIKTNKKQKLCLRKSQKPILVVVDRFSLEWPQEEIKLR